MPSRDPWQPTSIYNMVAGACETIYTSCKMLWWNTFERVCYGKLPRKDTK